LFPNVDRRAQLQLKHPFHHAEFLTTAAGWAQLPAGGAPEVAFAGRSNAGKSSVINALAGRSRLAYFSRTPGRTRHINFFRLPSGALMADLPGYGYAKVPAEMQRGWQTFVARYLAERGALVGLVLVMDARHPMTALDRKLLDWFLPTARPVRALLTKADKLSSSERRRALESSLGLIARDYATAELTAQLFSAVDRIGVAEAEKALGDWFQSPSAATEKERPRHQGE
jgi:GTP-binding protein